MNRRFSTRILPAVTFAAVAALAACDNPVDADEDHGEPVGVELLDRATGAQLAITDLAGGIHWDGELPPLHVGDEVAVNARFFDAAGNTIPLGGEYEVRASLATGAPTGIVALSNHGDHIDIEGVAVGETRIVFMLWHGGHSDWNSPAITVAVEAEGA